MQQASFLEGGPLMLLLPLYLYVKHKSDDDDDDDVLRGGVNFALSLLAR